MSAKAAAGKAASGTARFFSTRPGQIILLVLIVALFIWIIYRAGRKAADSKYRSPLQLPQGVQLPSGWSPTYTVTMLRSAMPEFVWYNPTTWADDEAAIFLLIEPLNCAQIIAVIREWQNTYGTDLVSEFQSNLSGSDLSRVMNKISACFPSF